MKIKTGIRVQMLSLVVDAIETGHDSYIPEKKIRFYNSAHTKLCEIEFDSLNQNIEGDLVYYDFLSTDATNSLRGIVLVDGQAATFEIQGSIIGENLLDDTFITGTVGGITSKTADIKFNNVNWVADTSITISKLTLSLPQGS